MASDSAAPVDLYIAVYDDPEAALGDWDAIKQLARDDVLTLDGLVLVSRRRDGKIHVDDDFHETAKGAVLGAVGGAVIARYPSRRPCLRASGRVRATLAAAGRTPRYPTYRPNPVGELRRLRCTSPVSVADIAVWLEPGRATTPAVIHARRAGGATAT